MPRKNSSLKLFRMAVGLTIRKGDWPMTKRQLFESFIAQNLDSAYRFAYTYTKNQQDAEDVVTESVIKALNNITSLKDTKRMKTWFFRIIINTAITYINTRNKVIPFENHTLEDRKVVYDDYSRLNFQQLIRTLDGDYKTIIVLRFFEDMKIADIAEVLQQNENTVKTKLYKALKFLKADLGGVVNE